MRHNANREIGGPGVIRQFHSLAGTASTGTWG
jgi:hypothetical protein